MGFLNFRSKKENDTDNFLEVFVNSKQEKLRIKEFMIEHAIDLIAKTISKSEIQVFTKSEDGVKRIINETYYTLNVRPNPNQDGTTFIYSLVSELLKENEALVIMTSDKNLHIADSWESNDSILNGKTYYDIKLSDNDNNSIVLNKTVHADDALYLSLGNSKIKETMDNFYKDYAEILKASFTGFKRSNYSKFKLRLPTNTQILKNASDGSEVNMKDYTDKIAGDLLKDEDSVISLSQSFDLEEIGKERPVDSKDTREIINDFGEKVAMAFNIPIDVYWGKKTDKSTSTDDFITFAVMPILNIIEDSFNAKVVDKKRYIEGERIEFNKLTIKHFDIMNIATSLDKLFAIGWSHNDLNEIIGVPIKNEDWANRHHVTKNYMDVNTPIEKKGGDQHEE